MHTQCTINKEEEAGEVRIFPLWNAVKKRRVLCV